jgi:hypothetical protein
MFAMEKEDIDYIEERFPDSPMKVEILQRLRRDSPITQQQRVALLGKLDYLTEPIEKEIRSHESYGSSSTSNAKAAQDMRRVLNDHQRFIGELKRHPVYPEI